MAKGKRKAAAGDVATNRRAAHRYHLIDRWEAGIQLQGSEVKSLRAGQVQLKDGYASLDDGEVWLHNVHISPYEPASRENHEAERPRKLLLHRREIEKIVGSTAEKGLTLVPTRVYFKGPRAKVEIALARGKDVGDKRRAMRDRDTKREIERLTGTTQERGLTLVPTRLYFKGPRAKVEIALARGKDLYDKRQALKTRESQREMQRALRDAERD